ncbi:twin-arginine translocase TatA/TatE family subunit [Cohnella silvisoli]|uniref:Twin-arginine translocase TatA/TatE family subunit n=1 Tax=Cohnella silvisoli TaxID=2873699 RepID=A0ABV1L272_9BACL|nr:twin-arginine translocase TatA/TatE family subunit [Cohnella silvisoli]MCD9025514.1 twin-arginine translocase TatA/TatE family subunit [Cohnella silvisoli]
MPLNIGWTGIIFLVFIALIFFGPSKLPQLGKAIGTTIREFRSGSKEVVKEDEADKR